MALTTTDTTRPQSGNRVFVIAEAGSCHDGELEKALLLIEQAAWCGADACKFQWTSDSLKLADRRNIHSGDPYSIINFGSGWLERLRAKCDQEKIEFMCTVYLPEDIPVIAPLVRRFKIASFEAGDIPFFEAHLQYRKQVIVSHGLGGINGPWWKYYIEDVKHLHCVSSYPCPWEEANLSMIGVCGEVHGSECTGCQLYDGLSDHTTSTLSGAVAVGAGATIIEKHFKHHTTKPSNPDYEHSLDKYNLDIYISNIRRAEILMGDGVKRVMPSEAQNLKYKVKS